DDDDGEEMKKDKKGKKPPKGDDDDGDGEEMKKDDKKGKNGKDKDGDKEESSLAVETKKLLDKAEDEYRLFFRRPQTVPEFWGAINLEMDTGKFDMASLFLKLMLKEYLNPDKEEGKKPRPGELDRELLKIEQVKGMSTFLRLKQVKKWHEHPELQGETE